MSRIASFAVVLLAIASSGAGCAKPVSAVTQSPEAAPMEAVGAAPSDVVGSGPFAGSWESCAGAEAPEQCSRYLLLQRGKRICGTWSYYASGDAYEGRVVAESVSPLEARRTRICGRPGSETDTECDAGWQTIDRPLRICDGKLGDLDGKQGACFADFERVDDTDRQLAELAAQPWVRDCLAQEQPGE